MIRFSARKIIRGDTVDTALWIRIGGPSHARRKHDGGGGPFAYTRAHYYSRTRTRTRDSRQVGPRDVKEIAGAPERRRVPRCRLIYDPLRSFFFSFLFFPGGPLVPPPSQYFRLHSSLSFSPFSLLPPDVYSVCVAHVSHGICYVVHGTPAAAADRLIRGPAPPLAFSFGCLDVLISPRFSRSPSRPPSSSARTYACKNHNPATDWCIRVSRRVRHVCVYVRVRASRWTSERISRRAFFRRSACIAGTDEIRYIR